MRRWAKKGLFAVLIIAVLAVLGCTYYQYQYPFGWSHCCDKQLAMALLNFAEDHDGWFPRGEETPEASFSLLYRQDPALAYTLRGKTVPESVVLAIFESGQLLTPETCGWHYEEGLRKDDDPRLALFWDKVGLGHNGERLSQGGHYVCYVDGSVRLVPGDRWAEFLDEQKQLRANLKRPR